MYLSYLAPDGTTTKYINATQVQSVDKAFRSDSINFSTVTMADGSQLELPAKPSTLIGKLETAAAATVVTAL